MPLNEQTLQYAKELAKSKFQIPVSTIYTMGVDYGKREIAAITIEFPWATQTECIIIEIPKQSPKPEIPDMLHNIRELFELWSR